MKDKNKILLVLGCLIALVGFIGISYAFWTINKVQSGENVITTGCLKMAFTETSDAITLNNTYPVTDDVGSTLEPYTFTLENTCNSKEYYMINLEILNTSTLNEKFVRVIFNNDVVRNLNKLNDFDVTLSNASKAKVLEVGSIDPDEVKTYSLRLFLGGEEATDELSMEKSFRSKVVITGSVGEIYAADEDSSPAAVIPHVHDGSSSTPGACFDVPYVHHHSLSCAHWCDHSIWNGTEFVCGVCGKADCSDPTHCIDEGYDCGMEEGQILYYIQTCDKTIEGYSCPDGSKLDGETCITYSCSNGGSLNGAYCFK